jgi:hypothetical protein
MVRSSAVSDTLNNFPLVLSEPAKLAALSKMDTGHTIVHYCKKWIDDAHKFTSAVPPVASMIRHINDTALNTLKLLKVAAESNVARNVKQIVSNTAGLVTFSDFFETVNDIHWFTNGGLAKSYAKGHYFDIASHAFFVPTDLLGMVMFGRSIDSSFMSFLGQWSAKIGRLPFLGFVADIAVAPACYTSLCLGYVSMGLDSIQKWVNYQSKITKLDEKPKDDLAYKDEIHNGQKITYLFNDAAEKSKKLEQLKTKRDYAVWNVIAATAKLTLNAIALGVLLKVGFLATVSGFTPVMIGLAVVAALAVGRNFFYGEPVKSKINYAQATAPAPVL